MLRSAAGHNYLFWISGLWLMPSCYNYFISSNWTAWILVHRWQASWRQTWIFWCTIFVEIWTCRFTSQWYSSSTFMSTLLLSTISDFAALALVWKTCQKGTSLKAYSNFNYGYLLRPSASMWLDCRQLNLMEMGLGCTIRSWGRRRQDC